MTRTTPLLREVAEQLLTIESKGSATDGAATPAARVCQKLKGTLGKLLGSTGFWALMSRALVLAQAEARVLRTVKLQTDGSFEGLEGVGARGEVIFIAHALGLLVTFVGTPLTIRLLQDEWPKAAFAKLDQGSDP